MTRGFDWSAPTAGRHQTFRRSRGKASTLLFPAKDPNRFGGIVLSARAAMDVPGLTATLKLNGKDLGEFRPGARLTTPVA